jgi:hypothetical protein
MKLEKSILPKCISSRTLFSQDELMWLEKIAPLVIRNIVALYVRGRVMRSVNLSTKNHIHVMAEWIVHNNILKSNISPISSTEKLSLTSSILKELE